MKDTLILLINHWTVGLGYTAGVTHKLLIIEPKNNSVIFIMGFDSAIQLNIEI